MKGKLSEIFKQIQKHEKKPPSPEKVASEFMEWKRKRLGQKVYYFKNDTRNKSRDWKYFVSLSEMLTEWRKRDIEISLWTYFDEHLKRVGRNKNLYPNQLILDYSHEIMLGRDMVNPEMVECVDTTGFTEAEMKEAANFVMAKLVETPTPEWEGIFDD